MCLQGSWYAVTIEVANVQELEQNFSNHNLYDVDNRKKYEPRCEKTICMDENKGAVTAKLITPLFSLHG